jgi:hypothetical protein
MNTHIADATVVREGRAQYFQAQHIPLDGGYQDRWVPVEVGPLKFAFPNTSARRRAVRFHDLHHVATGYGTDHVGESEIAAFEIGGGCGPHAPAWALNLYGMVLGLGNEPARLLPAFVRGRRSGTLYHTPWDESVLDLSVGELRSRLGLDRDLSPPTLGERLAFYGWMGAALIFSFGPLVLLALGVWGVLAR